MYARLSVVDQDSTSAQAIDKQQPSQQLLYRLQPVRLTAPSVLLEPPLQPACLLSSPDDLLTFQAVPAAAPLHAWEQPHRATAAVHVHAYNEPSLATLSQQHHHNTQQQPKQYLQHKRQQQQQQQVLLQPDRQRSKKGLAALLKACACGGVSCLPDRESKLDSSSYNSRVSFLSSLPPDVYVNNRYSAMSSASTAIEPPADPGQLARRSSGAGMQRIHPADQREECAIQHLHRSMSWQHVRVSVSSWQLESVDWHDAQSQFSCGNDHDHAAVDELASLVKELGFPRAHWVPYPPLVFGHSSMQFVPVPAVTGFAGYWERDDARTTPFPQPIDVMLQASYVVQKVHESIPGILMQETSNELSITAKPACLPKFLGIKCYIERFDKVKNTEQSWMPRRDLKLGRVYGKLYMTADGTLIARLWARPPFSSTVDVIVEEYMTLQEGGQVIVDRMTCLHVESGKRASQYLVGLRRPVRDG